jgi:hypothetical protein
VDSTEGTNYSHVDIVVHLAALDCVLEVVAHQVALVLCTPGKSMHKDYGILISPEIFGQISILAIHGSLFPPSVYDHDYLVDQVRYQHQHGDMSILGEDLATQLVS